MNIGKLWKVAKVAAKVIVVASTVLNEAKPIIAKKKRQVDREDTAGA